MYEFSYMVFFFFLAMQKQIKIFRITQKERQND